MLEVLGRAAAPHPDAFLTAHDRLFLRRSFPGKGHRLATGGLFEYAATISGATLFTAFTPAFALMMIWILPSSSAGFPWASSSIPGVAGRGG